MAVDWNGILKPEESVALRLRKLYRDYGYLHYKVGKFEEYDFYMRNKNFLPDGNILTFTDTDGRLMALKPDITLSIVKNAAGRKNGTQKFCYNENVYRTTGGGFREIMQTGLECIGALDTCAVSEVVTLAYKSLECFNGRFLLDLSHMGFVSDLIEDTGADEELTARLMRALGEKNIAEIKALGNNAGLKREPVERLCDAASLYGTPDEILPRMYSLAHGKKSKAAAEELKETVDTVCKVCDCSNLRIDFSLVNDGNYYNGIIFQGFLEGIPKKILAGGRYDKLMRKMGSSNDAIGFAVYFDEMLNRISGGYDVDILLIYDEGTPAAAVAEKAFELRNAGKSVRVSRGDDADIRPRETIHIGKEDTE